jgi:cholesterol oxidase
MTKQFDAVIIGSGFGGAVTACRLAEHGARVLVLERGRRWSTDTYPRGLGDPWFYDDRRPHRKNGWLDLRFFKRMIVAQGAGVGGGSLCYSSALLRSSPEVFDDGWPAEITFDELSPYYQRASEMLRPRAVPAGQHTRRHRLLHEAATQVGLGDRFFDIPLGVAFDEEFTYDRPNPLDKAHTRPFKNAQGRWQGTCVHLGNCDIGCDVQAKNALDLNYLAQAESHGAEIRDLHLARVIMPESSRFRVTLDRIKGSRLLPEEVTAERVIVAAGSLGSTELLLRCRDQFGTLPNLSKSLGKKWSPNGNLLAPAIYRDRTQVEQSIGPTMSAALNLFDGSERGQRFLITDDGFPNLLLHALRQRNTFPRFSPLAWAFPRPGRRGLDELNPLGHVMVWFGVGVDEGAGQLRLAPRWFAPWAERLTLDWNPTRTEPLIEAAIDVQRRLSEATGGKLHVPLLWRWFRTLITVHPLGGCAMGTSSEDGVVNHRGEVFGHPGLFVADGSIFPRPIGRNPSFTIAALAERIAHLLCNDGLSAAGTQ